MGIGEKVNAMAAHQSGRSETPIPSAPPLHMLPPNDSLPIGAHVPQEFTVIRHNVFTKLQSIVHERHLERMYPVGRLNVLADFVATHVDFGAVARQWKLPMELAMDLSSLSLYDIVIYADDSYSMQGSNWDSDLMAIVQRTAGVATLFDSDGIDVRFMNGSQDRDNIRTEAEVMQLLHDARPCGLTPIGTSLKAKILDPYVMRVRAHRSCPLQLKPVLVVTVTDGSPQGESSDTLFRAIRDCRAALLEAGFSGNEVAYQFAQVGDDEKAAAFLDELDNHPEIGQFVDATSNFEREAEQWHRHSNGLSEMTADVYLLKLLCGAIDSDWDAKDADPSPPLPASSPVPRRAPSPAVYRPPASQPKPAAPGCVCQ